MIKKLTLGIAASFLIAGIAIAGMFANYPKVGGSSYSCGSVNGVSNCTVPAGPSALTGNETIPADTNLANGQSPQTVLIPVTKLGGGVNTITFLLQQTVLRLQILPDVCLFNLLVQ